MNVRVNVCDNGHMCMPKWPTSLSGFAASTWQMITAFNAARALTGEAFGSFMNIFKYLPGQKEKDFVYMYMWLYVCIIRTCISICIYVVHGFTCLCEYQFHLFRYMYIMYFIFCWRPGSHSIKVSVLFLPNNHMQMLRFDNHAQMCLWKHMYLFSHFSCISNTLPPLRSEWHLHF